MGKRYVILYWLLILLPTLVISGALFQLLHTEQARIAEEAFATACDRARTIAETIRVTTRGIEAVIQQALVLMPSTRLEEQLVGFAMTTDLVNHVFLWSPHDGLLYPPRDTASPAQVAFIDRHEDLFRGRVPWGPPNGDEALQWEGDIGRAFGMPTDPVSPLEFGGWIPRNTQDGLTILGWARRRTDDIRYGIELSIPTLLAWLVIYFPESGPKGVEYALMDDQDGILRQTGDTPIPRHLSPALSVSLGPLLPQWNVAMFLTDQRHAQGSTRSFIILAGLLLAIFAVAVIVGGTLLAWQAHRNMLSAQQKTSFVSNVSHELKTPLTSIRMFAELLRENRIKDPTKKNHYLQVIVAESQRLTRLVNNVLDFSRLEQGRKKYHIKEIDITAFVRSIVETQRLRVQGAGMVLHDEVGEEACPIHTDEDAIEQVVLNLMDNAIKYASEGKELVIDLDVQSRPLRLRVMDRGPGIPSRHRARIFEKFHRVDDSLTARQPGSGLGLSIARSIMRELKGDLRYEPRVGGGSCFEVLIHAVQEA